MREFRFCIKFIFNRYEFYVALFVSLFIGGFHAVYTVQANQVLPDAGFSGDYLFILFNIFQNVYSFLILILPIALGLILSDSNWQEKYRGTETMLAVRLNRKKLIISRFIMSIIMSFVVAISGLLLNYLILRGCYGGGYRMTYNQEMPFAIRGVSRLYLNKLMITEPAKAVLSASLMFSLEMGMLSGFSYAASFYIPRRFRLAIYLMPLILLIFSELLANLFHAQSWSLIQLLQVFSVYFRPDSYTVLMLFLFCLSVLLLVRPLQKRDI